MNKAIERMIRMVRNFTVRSGLPPSLIRLNMPAPRLMRMSARSSRTIILMIIKFLNQGMVRRSPSLSDDGPIRV